MLPALWVAKTGLSAQDTNLTTISNNLANVSTTGFKRDRAEFQDLLYQIKKQPGAQSTQDSELPSGLQLGTGVQILGTQKNFSAGNLQQTGQPLDMAINGRGFFQIRRLARAQHDPGTGLAQRMRQLQAQPARATGDKGRFAREVKQLLDGAGHVVVS